MKTVSTLALACILAASCSTEKGIVGSWQYDRSRFDELDVVQRASASPKGTLGGHFADDSERAAVLRSLAYEARTTRFVFTDTEIMMEREGATGVRMAYEVVERAPLTLAIEEKGSTNRIIAELDSNKLTLKTPQGAVRYVLERR